MSSKKLSKIKRRIQAGSERPNDRYLFAKLSKELSFKNYLPQLEVRRIRTKDDL